MHRITLAVLLLVAACGGGSTAAFCDQVQGLETQFEDLDMTDPEGFAGVVDEFDAIEPPAEIADEWARTIEALRALSEIDFTDPAAIDQLQALEDQFPTLEADSEVISQYLETECGVTPET
jgi:hypothetical protein